MKRSPEPSTAIPSGAYSEAEVAGPKSPEKPWVPLPATVVMVPPGDTFRIRSLPESAMKRLPEASTATLVGVFRDAAVARPPSPENPPQAANVHTGPVPATVVIMPPGDTFRIRLFQLSAMNRLPEASTATPSGRFNDAAVAGPPSPE